MVNNAEEEAALGGGWGNSPAAFAPYKGPRRDGPEQYDPVKWVDEWPVQVLSEAHRKKIKAQLLKAHAAFWRSPDASNAVTEAMRRAFNGIAQTLFDARLLTVQLLEKDIPPLVWDSAIAGGWWRMASETRQDIFHDRLGRYWGWTGERPDCKMLLSAEAAEWQARLLEASAPVSDLAEPPKTQARRKRTESHPGPPASARDRAQSWKEVEIQFISDERVQVWIAGKPETCNYAEMGFTDRRNGTPGKSWIVLRTLAQHQGMIPTAGRSGKGWAGIEKQIQRTRKLLQSYFGILKDPLPFERGVGYRLRCKIGRAPSFDK
jgi:hypothetical protein